VTGDGIFDVTICQYNAPIGKLQNRYHLQRSFFKMLLMNYFWSLLKTYQFFASESFVEVFSIYFFC
jgi:hypothetical protein